MKCSERTAAELKRKVRDKVIWFSIKTGMEKRECWKAYDGANSRGPQILCFKF